jgi:hypothetical protein
VSGATDIGVTDRPQSVATLDETSGRGIDDSTDGVLPDTGGLRELDALESDMQRYLVYAAVIDALEFLWVYLALPGLAYLLFAKGHETLAIAFAIGWLIVAIVHVMGVPFSYRDRQRGQALLRQLQDLHAVLGNPPISRTRLQALLNQANAAGVVLDASVFTLVDRLVAVDATADLPRPLDVSSPSCGPLQSGD